MTKKQAVTAVWTLAEYMIAVRDYFAVSAYKRANGKFPHGMQKDVLAAIQQACNSVSPVIRGKIDQKFQDISAVLCAQDRPDLVCPGFLPRRDKEGNLYLHVSIDEKARIKEADPMLWKLCAAHILQHDSGIVHAVPMVRA